jgi:nitrogen fixation protein NifB
MSAANPFENHPCFSPQAKHLYGRLHLPVAPRCNMQCNFCNRKYDCINESRPGVTSTVLQPHQALAYAKDFIAKRPETKVVGIAGPGDPFANPDETMETLRLIRAEFPDILLCVATNGLAIGPYIEELARLKVSHVTITVTAIDPAIASEIYAWLRDGKRPLRGEAAATLLLSRQKEAVRRLKALGVVVKINSIIVPGVNDEHFAEIARNVKEWGADIMNVMPLVPVAGSAFEQVPPPDAMMAARLRLTCGLQLPQMSHCSRCRADAAGMIGETVSPGQIDTLKHYATLSKNPAPLIDKPYVAVASLEGALVNQHLGEADRVLVYAMENANTFRLHEIRQTPAPGGGDERWKALAAVLKDCRALLVSAAGPAPMRALAENGLPVIEMEGLIEEGLRAVFANQPIPAAMARRFTGCGAGFSCKGAGTGCG